MSHAPLIDEDDDGAFTDDDDNMSHNSHSHLHDNVPNTPTKRRRAPDDTPRQLSYDAGCSTPRPRIEPINFGSKMPVRTAASSSSDTGTGGTSAPKFKGFTLSYLRRVPELSLLASRVVEAVARRHYREERKRLKEAKERGSSSSSRPKPSSSSALVAIPPTKFAEKKKRLFKWAVIELLNEGGIALWDGPARRCPPTDARAGLGELSRLWKLGNSTTMTVVSDSSLFGNTATAANISQSQETDEGYLSPATENFVEESYIPLTPPYLAAPVEAAISVLVAHYTRIGKPYAGATKEGILSVLRKDDRWQFVGDWSVEETLVWLKEKGRVWKMPGGGSGRWDLTA